VKVGSFPEPVDIVEEVVLTMDFANDQRLAEGETISSPVVNATVRSGTDPDVGTLLIGSPVIVGTKVLCRKARNKGVSGCTYAIEFQVDTSNTQRLILVGLLACRDAVSG
jgi:hypothetical protein